MSARHQQVADDLRRLITTGALSAGERLPPETRLASEYRVSTPTLRDALELLRAEGLIEKFQGRGNFVRRPSDRLTYPREANGVVVSVNSSIIAAPSHLAARLDLPLNAPLTEYVCLSHRDDSPCGLAYVYVPRAAVTDSPSLTGSSPWGDDIIATACGPVTTSTDQVTARFPTAAEAQSLRIAGRTPVLAIERTIAADDGHGPAYVLLVLPGDRTEAVFATRIDKKSEA
jgi:GntR family transcriptional regulator